jgi:hypothetical protein
MSDYADTLQRAARLNGCRDALLNTNSCASSITLVEPEDVLIYLRWLICNFYAQKTFQHSIKLIEWLPCHLSTEYLASSASNSSVGSTSSSNISNLNTTVSKSADTHNLLPGQNLTKSGLTGTQLENIYSNSTNTANVNNYNMETNSLVSLSSILNAKFKLIDNIFLPTTHGLVNRDEILNSISFCECCRKNYKWDFFFS